MKYVSDKDGVIYKDARTLSGQSLEVVKADNPELRLLFSFINKSLNTFYQPITIQYDTGVLICSELGEFFLKEINFNDEHESITVTVFGDESVYTFPLKRKQIALIDNGKNCEYVECSADHTSLFSIGTISFGKYQLRTVTEKGIRFVRSDELNLNIQGELLGYTEDYMCTSTEGVIRVWSADSAFNEIVRMLPVAISLLLSKDGELYLSGYLNAPLQQYKVISLKKIDHRSVDIQVCTVDNEFLPFYLTFCNDGGGDWTVLVNGLPVSTYKSKQIF